MTLHLIDSSFLNERFTHHILLKNECKYEVPPDFKIVSNGKMYAIKSTHNSTFLHNFRNYSELVDPVVLEPTLFFTECKAKAFLKKHLKSKELNNFDEFK
jgi:hypothetical protein